MGQSRPLFVYFCYFLITISIIQIEKSIDGVLGIRTQDRRQNHGAMVAAPDGWYATKFYTTYATYKAVSAHMGCCGCSSPSTEMANSTPFYCLLTALNSRPNGTNINLEIMKTSRQKISHQSD